MPQCVRTAVLAAVVHAAAASTLGCNVGGNAGRGFHFADLVKQAVAFGPVNGSMFQNATVDAAGWPTQDFSLVLYYEGAGPEAYSYPPAQIDGVYTITAAGCGTVAPAFGMGGIDILNSTCTSAGTLLAYASISANTTLVNGNIQFVFTGTSRNPWGNNTDPNMQGPGLVNVSVLQPGYPAGTDPTTLAAAALDSYKFCSLIRFMPWTLAQSRDAESPPTSSYWRNRAQVAAPSYLLGAYGTLGPGVPWEIAANMANTLGTDVWVNIPPGLQSELNASAIDEYIVQVVTLMDALLPDGRKIYVEWGNEVWNSHFWGFFITGDLANASVYAGDPLQLNFGLGPPNQANLAPYWIPRYIAYMAVHIADLAGQVVGKARVGSANTPGVRVVPVLGAQGSYEPQGEGLLEYINTVWGAPRDLGVGTMAIGGYVGMGANDSATGLTLEEVIDGFMGNLANMSTAAPTAYCGNALADYVTLVTYYGLDLHAYEGSPDTSGSHDAQSLMAKAQAVMDPRMTNITIETIHLWQSWGGGTYNWFTGGASSALAPWGSYSTLWDVRVPDTPKTAGIAEVLAKPRAAVTAGFPLPVHNQSAALKVGYYTSTCEPPPFAPVTWLPANSTMNYLVRRADTTASCALSVTVYMYNGNATAAGQLHVSVGAFLPPVTITAPAYSKQREFTPVVATFPPLPAGVNTLMGLITIRLTVPPEGAQGYQILSFDAACN